MRVVLLKVSLGALLLLGIATGETLGQVITQGPDSTLVQTEVPAKQKGLSKPGKAALMSAIVPGLGQAYNRSYWKIPIIYLAGGVLGYALRENHHNYLDYRRALLIRQDTIPNRDQPDQFTDRLEGRGIDSLQIINSLKRARDSSRRYRDYTILYCLLAYGLNVTEAYVHAHLKGFDVGEELSMRVQPDFIQTSPYSFAPAFSLSIKFKK